MASRPNDRMGVSGWYDGLSDEFTDLRSVVGIFLRNTWGFEWQVPRVLRHYASEFPSLLRSGGQ
jgi:hypothetical protein